MSPCRRLAEKSLLICRTHYLVLPAAWHINALILSCRVPGCAVTRYWLLCTLTHGIRYPRYCILLAASGC